MDSEKKISSYWSKKPVNKWGERVVRFTENKKTTISMNSLPLNYLWKIIDIYSEDIKKVVDFINNSSTERYIEIKTIEKIQWELKNGFFLCLEYNETIIACLASCYRSVVLDSNTIDCTEQKYLLCDSGFRNLGICKRIIDKMEHHLIQNGYGISFQCNNLRKSRPIAGIRYYSRPINYKLLKMHDMVEVKGCDEDAIDRTLKIKLKLPKNYKFVEKTNQNIDLLFDMYKKYMETFNLSILLTRDEVEHYLFSDNVKTLFVCNQHDQPIDFITYMLYDLYDKKIDSSIKCAKILMYTSNNVRIDLLIINCLKAVASDDRDILYIPDIMHSNELILSSLKTGDMDSDGEENSTFDIHILKTNKKQYITLYGGSSPSYTQNMISWLLV